MTIHTTTGALHEPHEAPEPEPAPTPSARPAKPPVALPLVRLLSDADRVPPGMVRFVFRAPTLWESGCYLRDAAADLAADRFPTAACHELLVATCVEPTPEAFGALLADHPAIVTSVGQALANIRDEFGAEAGLIGLAVSVGEAA